MIKNRFVIFFIIITIITAFTLPVFAAGPVYNWYCVHRNDHKQPTSDHQLSFINRYGGYYIDKKHGDNDADKVIYLTFDVGYENGNVEKVLDAMKECEVKGAFFILENVIDKNPELVKRMFDEGHLVCNHTSTHKSIVGRGKAEIERELCQIEKKCLEVTGSNMSKYFRPPEGKFDETSLMYVNDLGYKTVFWSFAYADWDNGKQMDTDKAYRKIMDNVHNGEVMLLHPTSETNAKIMKRVINDLKMQGFRFGSLDELCKE